MMKMKEGINIMYTLLMVTKEQLRIIGKTWKEKKNVFNLVTEDGEYSLMVKINKSFRKGRAVRMVEDDKIFDSVKEAAYNYDVSEMAIIKSIQEKRKCQGRTFEYVERKEKETIL